MTKQFYFYSDLARYDDQIALNRLPMLKIGETTQNTTAQRVLQQDTTSCAQVLDLKRSFIVPDSVTDKQFHVYLEQRGYTKTRDNREWFYISVEDAEVELNDFINGVVRIEKYFSPRPHQAWVNQQILDRFDGTQTIIQPLDLCARFGKTLQALSLFKDSGLQVMVIAGYWLAANQSFVNTINERFDIAADIAVIAPDYQQFKAAVDRGQRVLIDVSLHTDAADIDSQLINALADYQSLIYIDEADFGAWTSSSRNTANQFIDTGVNLVCVATGTNIDRALIGTQGNLEPPIKVAYLDLIEAKRGEGYLFQPGGFCSDNPQQWQNTLSDIVDVDVWNLDAGEDLVEELNELSDEKRPNMTKVFNKRNAHIQTKIIKSIIYDEDFGADIFGMYAEQYELVDHPALMWFIPGTKSDVNNLVKIGKSIAPQYNWIALHGDDYTNRTAEDAVKNAIASGGERTIIVSCSMGARSFSVPNIVAVINSIDGGSVGSAVQQASRCFTPGCGKSRGLVVNYSFNTGRTSSFETDLISSAIQQNPSDSDGAVRRVYGLINFFKGKDEEGYAIKVSEGDFLEYVTTPENLNNMGKATIDIHGLISNAELVSILEDIHSKSTTNREWSGAINKAITYIKSDKVKDKNEPDAEKKAIRDLVKKISSVVECTSNVYYLAPSHSTFKDCLSDIASDPNKNAEYNRLVGVDANVVFTDICNFLNLSIMDLIIAKASKLDSTDNFSFSSSDHAVNLFNL